MSWEFTLERLAEIKSSPREAMIGRQEAERLVDFYLSDYKRGRTCSHCSCDMSQQKPHERCSNGGLCVSIEEFEERKIRDLVIASQDIVRIAYANGRGGLVEFRPHEFDDLQSAVLKF
jgi:hypothetical protein